VLLFLLLLLCSMFLGVLDAASMHTHTAHHCTPCHTNPT
jgi:hypothetical protein